MISTAGEGDRPASRCFAMVSAPHKERDRAWTSRAVNCAAMPSIISISQLTKRYASGLEALKSVSLDIAPGEIFALLGPNGAGKTTLISIVCGLVTPTSGTVKVEGFDILREYRETRSRIGLVPQELHTDMFET